MAAILYYLLIYPISLLPYGVLYFFSDVVYFLVFNVVGYRKKVVLKNLRNSFPEKSEKEIKQIAKGFYKHFCDLIFETIKGFSISEKSALKRMKVVNVELLNEYHDQGKEVLITGGHYANWEAYTYTANRHRHILCALYTPLSNGFLNKKMKTSREKFTMKMVPTKRYKSMMEEKGDQLRAFIFACDQSPRKGSGHRMQFLNQDTMALFGTEKTAVQHNMPIVYGHIDKVKRGYYEISYSQLIDDPSQYAAGEITEIVMKKLEEKINAKPEFWLWTHKRWKHKPQ